jgi:hypothetical protein
MSIMMRTMKKWRIATRLIVLPSIDPSQFGTVVNNASTGTSEYYVY